MARRVIHERTVTITEKVTEEFDDDAPQVAVNDGRPARVADQNTIHVIGQGPSLALAPYRAMLAYPK